MKRFLAAIFLCLLISGFWFPSSGYAACFSPAGNAGDVIYYGGYQSDMYCDGGAWVSMGGSVGNTTNGLVGWWKLDETSGTSASDSSGISNTGTLQAAASWTTSGMNNGALNFNGTTQYVTVPDAASLDIAGSWTVATWVNLAALPASGHSFQFIQKIDAGGRANYGLFMDNGESGPGIGWTTYFNTTTTSDDWKYVPAPAIATGTWYHVAEVFDSSAKTLSLYVNGVLVMSNSTGTDVPVSDGGGSFYLGTDGFTAKLKGTLDDARVYNRALSATDVMTLYTSTGPWSGDITTGLIHYWKLDEGSGTTANDSAETATMTKTGTAAFTASGKINGGVSLPNDGTAKYFSVTAPGDILGVSKLTMSMWFKRGALGSLVGAGQENPPSGGNSEISISPWSDGIVYFELGTAAGDDNGGVANNDTNWHMATFVFDGTQSTNLTRLTGYIDGVAQALTFVGTIPATTVSTAYSFHIGAEEDTDHDYGTIDEVRIYNRALSASDVLTLYNTTATACASPAGYSGDLLYNNASHVPQFCNASAWIPMGPVPGAGGSGCSSPTGSEGTFVYNADNHVTQFCDGTNWVAAGENVPISGLVGWWNLDEGSGTTAADSSGNGNTGTMIGTVTWQPAGGKIGGAGQFTGGNTQSFNIGNPASLQLTGSLTIAGWIKGSSSWNTAQDQSILFKSLSYVDNATPYGLTLTDDCTGGGSMTTGFLLANSGGTACYELCGNTHLSANTWYFVAAVYNATGPTVNLYLNGVLDNGAVDSGCSLSTPPSPLLNNTAPVGLGGIGPTPIDSFTGLLDDVRVYNRALSASEVWRLYNGAP